MHRLTGFAIALLLTLAGFVCSSDTVLAGEPPQFWQSNNAVVRVVDLPDSAMFKRGYNDYLDLGYHFLPDGSGNWVGYSTKGRREKLDTVRLGMMLAAANLDRLPLVPQRPASSATYLFFIANGLVQLTLLLRIVINHHVENQSKTGRKNRALNWRSLASRKKNAKDAKQSVNSPNDYVQDPLTSIDPDSGPVFGQRGLQAAAVSNAKFGRRGW